MLRRSRSLRRRVLIRLAVAACCVASGVSPLFAQPLVVIPFGDSITHGLGDDDVMCDAASGGYPPRLRSALGSRGLSTEMRTRGVCGELTSEGVTRFDKVLNENPDAGLTLIMEGTNDLSSGNISTETVAFNIRTMALRSIESEVRPVVASVIPRSPEAGNNNRTFFFDELISELATDLDLDYANQFRLVNINNLYEEFYSDPFHPNAAGYSLVANNFIQPTLNASERPIEAGACELDDNTLCILGENRFRVEVSWRDFADNTGFGHAVPLTSDTGYFWFFDESNVELIVKAIDGKDFNEMFWIFYGALSTVEYTITVVDTVSGRRKTYFNPSENLASVGDTSAFPSDPVEEPPEDDATAPSLLEALDASPVFAKRVVRPANPDRRTKMECVDTLESMCLNDDRFEVKARWTDFQGNMGTGKAEPLTNDTGYFWFFSPVNVEVMLKVLDGRENNGNYWVFFGALSNVEFEIEVTDTETEETVVYFNPSGNFGSRADTSAFAGS